MELSSKVIQKYDSKTLSKLIVTATNHFNKYIRLRDSDDNGNGYCISSGQHLKVPSENAHAGHYYSAGQYKTLKFNPDNVHLQGKSDNYFKSGNLIEYRKNLIRKIGQERVDKLDQLAAISKRGGFKWHRLDLIEIIETYKELNSKPKPILYKKTKKLKVS